MSTKLILTAVIIGIVSGGAGVAIKRAVGGPPPPPSSMPVEAATRLDRDLAHIREAQMMIARVQQEAKPYADEATALADQYRFDLQALLSGSVTIDFKTGEIHRPQAPPTPPDMAPASRSAKR